MDWRRGCKLPFRLGYFRQGRERDVKANNEEGEGGSPDREPEDDQRDHTKGQEREEPATGGSDYNGLRRIDGGTMGAAR